MKALGQSQWHLGWKLVQAVYKRDTYCLDALNCKRAVTSGPTCSGPDTVQEFMWQEALPDVAERYAL